MTTSPSLFKPCLDALVEPLFIFSDNRSPVFANRAFLELLGRTSLPEQAKFIWPNHERHQSLSGDFTAELLHQDGHTVLVRFLGTNIGEQMVLLKVVSAQRKTDQLSLFHSQRLETLGLLSGAVAHDFNNVLTGILGHATYLRAVLGDNPQVSESLKAIEDGIKKGASITAQVLQFSKVENGDETEPVFLRDVITKTLTLLRKAIPTRLKLLTHYEVQDVSVLSTEGKLGQVLVNLVMNARDAIEDQGELEVSLRVEKDIDTLKTVLKTDEPACSSYAVLSVRDTGTGIEDSLLEKIFEPFFTTKREKGTGLGLYTISEICKKLGGSVSVNSKLGFGTVVSVYLPVQTVIEREEEKISRIQDSILRGTERILIVDDELSIRNVLSVSLQHLGYKVSTASSALEALRDIKKDGLPYDLIITDMLMPGMSGEEFFFEVKKEYPNANFLVISGFSAEGSVERMLEAGARGFLPKPFTIEELSGFVRRSL